MPPSKAERKAELTRVAEELIDRMLAEEKSADEIKFEDIEQAATEGAARGDELTCPDCGKRMVYQGLRRRAVVSAAGEVTIQRGYYYCRTCKRGTFPPR